MIINFSKLNPVLGYNIRAVNEQLDRKLYVQHLNNAQKIVPFLKIVPGTLIHFI